MWSSSEAMSQRLLDDWRMHIRREFEECDEYWPFKLQGNLRGVFVGISAVFHAAKKAGCEEKIMPKDAFLACLEAKRLQLLESPPELTKNGEYDHRALANIVLVH